MITAADVSALDAAVRAVCPIDGVTVGEQDDRTTWKFAPKANATDEQKRAAQAAIDAFDTSNQAAADRDLVARIGRVDAVTLRVLFNHENRIRALEGKQAVSLAQFAAGIKALLA